MAAVEAWLDAVSGFVWGWPLLVLLFGTHVFLTFRLGFPQRWVWTGIRLSIARDPDGEGDVSHFGALVTALAATIGTGNIVGVATAVAAGGPGAMLWMWLTGVFGIATKYAESLLAVHYRVKLSDGTYAGGAMYALERGLGARWLGLAFAGFTAVAAFGIGNMVQANSVAQLALDTGGIPTWVSGIVLTVATACVIVGGIRTIARVCQLLVPFMALFYVVGCAILLWLGADTLPATIALIVESAFTGQAAVGGFAGAGIVAAARFGIARGLFSNESGLGSAPIVAAAARTRDPVRQALVSSTGTFWDTVVVCAMTGLVVVNSGHWQDGLTGAKLTHAAFADIPTVGPMVLTVGLLTFVFSTILGWSYYGERAVAYLFGTAAIAPYRWLWVVAVMIGSVATLPAVWAFADIANALMALPNIVALLALQKVIADQTRKHLVEGRERP
jgi:AGCS family alanine or glycine:cation symporter